MSLKVRIVLAMALVLAFVAQVVPVHGQSCSATSGFYVASLNANIDPGAADYMSSTVSTAQGACDGHIVFVLNTNGGDGGSMESMINSIASYQGWGGQFWTVVAPQDTHAWSAGAYIAEASTKIYMVRNTSIGAATPIVSGIPVGEENGTYSKDIGAFSAYMRTLASTNGRNASAAERMVTIPAQTYSAGQAKRLHVIDGVVNATSLSDALAALGVPASTPINTPGLRSQFISVLSDPNVSGLLFLVGVFAVLADVYHPTIILSIVGVVVIAAALFGLGVFGATPLAILLMIIGAGFIFLEIKTQHGLSAIVGVVIFVVGFLLVYQFPPGQLPSPSGGTSRGANFSNIQDITYGLLVALGAAVVIGSLYLRSIREGLKRRPKVNDPALNVGKEGKMRTDLLPGGKGVAVIGAEDWTVISDQALTRGDRIRVKAVSGLALTVEKVEP